jgi:hypothetical protein
MVYDFDRSEFRPETIDDLAKPGYARNPAPGLDVPDIRDLLAVPTIHSELSSPAEGYDI